MQKKKKKVKRCDNDGATDTLRVDVCDAAKKAVKVSGEKPISASDAGKAGRKRRFTIFFFLFFFTLLTITSLHMVPVTVVV